MSAARIDPALLRHVDDVLLDALTPLEAEGEARVERHGAGSYVVTLPTRARPYTWVWFEAGDHALNVESFFLRRPDEAVAGVRGLLLGRNLRSYGVTFALDGIGDLWLVGRLPYASLTVAEVDRVLGQVVTHVEEALLPAVAHGFATALAVEPELREKVLADGAGRRVAGADDDAQRDPRR